MPDRQTITWNLHGLTLAGTSSSESVGERWLASFASLPLAAPSASPDLALHLFLIPDVPPAPAGAPDFQQGDLLAYYLNGSSAVAHFPRYGQLRLDLQSGRTEGVLTQAALTTHGVFEDLLAIGLSPHLRRRGMFLLHALAAAPAMPGGLGPAALLVGEIGAGKTTSGLALLHAGWRLLSNDSPILRGGPDGVRVLAYPGLLSAYPDSLARFPELSALPQAEPTGNGRQKTLFAAEHVYPGVWAASAAPGAILFPRIEPRAEHLLEPLSAPEALRQLLPHAIEQWDRALIPAHLALLNQLAQSTPAFRLRLGPNMASLPGVVEAALKM